MLLFNHLRNDFKCSFVINSCLKAIWSGRFFIIGCMQISRWVLLKIFSPSVFENLLRPKLNFWGVNLFVRLVDFLFISLSLACINRVADLRIVNFCFAFLILSSCFNFNTGGSLVRFYFDWLVLFIFVLLWYVQTISSVLIEWNVLAFDVFL